MLSFHSQTSDGWFGKAPEPIHLLLLSVHASYLSLFSNVQNCILNFKCKKTIPNFTGLKGDKWHIGCYRTVRKDEDDQNEWLVQNDLHVAVLKDDSAKTSNTVIGIVRKSLEHFRLGHPEIREIALRFDNAGKFNIIILCSFSLCDLLLYISF